MRPAARPTLRTAKCAPGMTGHTEVVLVVFDPKKVRYEDLLKVFWESHDPTQGMRQGNDVGTQYRSGVYGFDEEQLAAATASRDAYQRQLSGAGYGAITTEILPAPEFYYAEDYHQQYLAKNPNGYCGIGGTGVSCPVGVAVNGPSRSRTSVAVRSAESAVHRLKPRDTLSAVERSAEVSTIFGVRHGRAIARIASRLDRQRGRSVDLTCETSFRSTHSFRRSSPICGGRAPSSSRRSQAQEKPRAFRRPCLTMGRSSCCSRGGWRREPSRAGLRDERGWTIGREIGWQIRFERRFTDATRLLVATEGVLSARLQRDPLLSDFRTIVIDEFHERSVHADRRHRARETGVARA